MDKISGKLIAFNQRYRYPGGPVTVTNKLRKVPFNIFGFPARNIFLRHTLVVYSPHSAPRLCGKFAIPRVK